MKWELVRTEATQTDPYGLGAFLRRLETELVRAGRDKLSGFTFLQAPKEMLVFTRRIENQLLNTGNRGPLYVGFQNTQKLDGEADRYRSLQSRGVIAFGFGEGTPAATSAEGLAEWHALGSNHTLLENQWFLVTLQPDPLAFVGWEVSDESMWGAGGITAPGKQFVGFVSDDLRVVQAFIRYLDQVREATKAAAGEPRGLRHVLREANSRRVLILVDDGKRAFLKRGLDRLMEAGLPKEINAFLYDLSAESYLVNPYPEGTSEHRAMKAQELRQSFGRAHLADLIEKLETDGFRAYGILPWGVGFGHLADWCLREKIDTVIMPSEYARPSLLDQLKGYQLDVLRSKIDARIILEDADRGAWPLHAITEASELASA